MKLITPDIVYHNIQPVYTCDIQTKSDDFVRLATGGFDCAVRLWKLNYNYSSTSDFRAVELVANLNRHEKRVNVVRWSPSGNLLASASDDGVIILWHKSNENVSQKIENDDEINLENWSPRCLRRHFQDVYDICWSMNENHLISGSIDCCAILWNLSNINKVIILKDHKQFVQGVAWDPLDNVVITQSSDRTMRVYRASSRTCIYKVWKSGDSKLFQDGSWKYFFRRLVFSPDGKLLVTPAGFYEPKKSTNLSSDPYISNSNDNHAAHIFVRHNLSKVAVTIPTGKNAVIGVRFNPVRFSLNRKSSEAVFNLPYRWVFCLLLDNGVLIYDTEQCVPIVKIFNIHCLSINDASWSPDGHCLVMCSTDGFCSFVYFEQGELGDTYKLVANPCSIAIPQPLKPLENIIGESDETKRKIVSNNNQNLPVLELDPTEILQVSPTRPDYADSCSDDTDACQDGGASDDMVVESDLNEAAVHVDVTSGHTEQLKPAISSVQTEIKEPEQKKRRITFTTLAS